MPSAIRNPALRLTHLIEKMKVLTEKQHVLATHHFLGALRQAAGNPKNKGKLNAKHVADSLSLAIRYAEYAAPSAPATPVATTTPA